MASETITGFVDNIIFQNTENGYTVLELKTDGQIITVTGCFAGVSEGETLSISGEFVTHPSYGEQFNCESYEITEPGDLLSIERYLGSGAVKGIGPSLAAKIVKRFGEDTLRVLDEEPELLSGIKGISENGAREIAARVYEKKALREAMMFLQGYGISLGLSAKIYEQYKEKTIGIIRENPYRLADDIQGIGFRIADEIARKTGFKIDCDFRKQSGIYHTLVIAVGEGNVYLPKEILMIKAAELLGMLPDDLEDALQTLVIEKKVIIKEKDGHEIVYAAKYYYMERNVAYKLADLDEAYEVDESLVDRILLSMKNEGEFEIDPDQHRAILSSLSHGVTVITGGPGTGKTTTINAIIKVFEEEGLLVQLAAPTGRAAKRMTEATGYEARTLHRLLEFSGIPGGNEAQVRFLRDESNPLEADVVIVDEMSMVDIFLMSSLVKAIPIGSRLIMVGDANQLPSVGPGNVLHDLIESKKFHVVFLNHIFRQSEAGDIIINAHKINDGEIIDPDVRSNDFIFVKRGDIGHITGSVETLVKKKLPEYVNAKPFDIQVLTPMRKGALGVINLNNVLQEALNPPSKEKKEHEFPQGIFREGDKVMQIKNNYDIEWVVKNSKGMEIDEGKGVFNGDLGIIKRINLFSEEVVVAFDENREVTYPFINMNDLELAYAVTVHKSQGSEYPAVVIPLLSGPRQLMNRNLIYTAVTRAKKCVCIVGNPDTFNGMILNNEEQKRYTGLTDALSEIKTWKETL